jgi:hypothetical protein
VILGADPPIHAPATVAGAPLAEEVFKGGPQRGRKRSDRELHVAVSVSQGTWNYNSGFMLACLPIPVI